MKILWIGDMHLRVSDLTDADTIIDQLLSVINQEMPELVILAGDQFDTFGVVRSEILAHWTRFFVTASKNTKVVALVGNHDLAGATGGVSAMEPFKAYSNVEIIDSPKVFIPFGDEYEIHFVPFIRSTEEFEAICRKAPAGSIVFCHQSFNGAKFENGFFDPHGADVECAKHLGEVISGHVHKAQKIANICYPGTPRQLTFSDAGETKAIFTMSLGKGTYTIDKAHVLALPKFEVWECSTIDKLRNQVDMALATTAPGTSANVHVKFSAKGTPSEIAQFWQSPSVIEFKSKAKRVVDALTSMKPITAFITVTGHTQSEKLVSYITERNWRTDAGELATKAIKLLS